MTNDQKHYAEQYELIKKQYAAEKNPLKRTQLKAEGMEARIRAGIKHPSGGCYCCGNPTTVDNPSFPHCSPSCLEKWADRNDLKGLTGQAVSAANLQLRIEKAAAYGRGQRP